MKLSEKEREQVSPTETSDGDLECVESDDTSSFDYGSADIPAETATAPRWRRVSRRTVLLSTVIILAIAFWACAVFQYWAPNSNDRAVDSISSRSVGFAASSTVKILSYKHDSVDRDVATATILLTGDFLQYYRDFTANVVIPAAKKEQVDTVATTVGSALERADATSATVLVYVNQSTVTAGNQTPTLSASSVRVVVEKVDGALKVSKFDPV